MRNLTSIRRFGESAYCGLRYLYFSKPRFLDFVRSFVSAFFYVEYERGDGRVYYDSFQIRNRPDLLRMQSLFFESLRDVSFLNYKKKFNFLFVLDWYRWLRYFLSYPDSFGYFPTAGFHKAIIFFRGCFLFSTVSRMVVPNGCANVFCDSVGLDASVAKLCNFNGNHVTCIQHGQYRYEPQCINSDLVPFINNCGSKILVWGEATLNEYARADLSNYSVEVVGRYFDKTAISKQVDYKKLRFLCIVLNGPDSSIVNVGLYNLALQFSVKYNVEIVLRKHPADNNKYSCRGYDDVMFSETLFLCYSSGFIVESLIMRRRIVVFNDGSLPRVYESLPCCVKSVSDIALIFDKSDVAFWNCLFDKYAKRYVVNA